MGKVSRLNKDLKTYLENWFKNFKSGGLDKGIRSTKEGLEFTYFENYHTYFLEKDGEVYFVFGVDYKKQGLEETIRKESPSSSVLNSGKFVSKREFLENGNYTRVKVRIKRFPDNLNILFDSLKGKVIKPFLRGVDKTRRYW